ncbi:hypothetical protein [Ornithinimicrobium sp. LYQ103]|uniref:hypothetical protein n=1 Tax=Ornithinimicrobium sp. LYQ103 TaxID=3378796 RepID=UPI003852E981
MNPLSPTRLLVPTAATGALMATYLLLRPYGDGGGSTTPAAAEAFASPWWVLAHVCGGLSLAAFGWLALAVSDLTEGRAGRLARWAGPAGVVLVLPYYGAETYGLQAVGARAVVGDPTALALVEQIRNQPVGLTLFALGLLLLAVSGVATALACQRAGLTSPAWAAWPLGIGVALVLPQFFLPSSGRVVFGLAYALAATVLIVAVLRSRRTMLASTEPALARGRAAVAG